MKKKEIYEGDIVVILVTVFALIVTVGFSIIF